MGMAFRVGVVSALVATVASGLMAGPATAGTVTVVTSFPRDLTQAYKAAFEKAHPGIRIDFLTRNTVQAIDHLRTSPEGRPPDVIWASAPDAFELLAQQGLLAPVADLAGKGHPVKVGSYPINSPQGLYLGQALAGYGLMWNTRYLAAKDLAAPRHWEDLARPAYFGHVAMSPPSRSGTTHLTVETVLQGKGWDEGWSLLLKIAGNCAALPERSFGVPDGIKHGQFGVGLVIDFFGLAAKYTGHPVEFTYPEATAIVPASVGLLAGSTNPKEAREFIRYTVSREGQQLLYTPKISRLPILPARLMGAGVPHGYPDPFAIAERSTLRFDSALSRARYHLVSSVFDQTVTAQHTRLQAATRAIHAAQAALGPQSRPEAQALLESARRAAFAPIVDAARLSDPQLLALFASNRKDPAVNQRATALEEQWSRTARDNYARARSLAEQALAQAR